ncbi:MAG: glycosyltransferase [Gammaproteobacteria bacterium]|nr:glycosyltransferase [Gammaproteobacteria bacterium]
MRWADSWDEALDEAAHGSPREMAVRQVARSGRRDIRELSKSVMKANSADSTTPELSVVLPVYNEEDNLVPLYDEIVGALASLDFEILFIDDGSTDRSGRAAAPHPGGRSAGARRGVPTQLRADGRHRRRSRHGAGRFIATLDADRQNDPADIPAMLDRLGEGFDMVCGWRHKREDGFWLRLLPSKIANRIISPHHGRQAARLRLHAQGHGCRRRQADPSLRRDAPLHSGHRQLGRGAHRRDEGQPPAARRGPLEVRHITDPARHPRPDDGEVPAGYAGRPIQLFGSLGLLSGSVGFVMVAWLLFERLVLDQPLAGRPVLLFAILLVFIGLQFITVGLLAEMQTRTYYESRGKPIYAIREVVESADAGG